MAVSSTYNPYPLIGSQYTSGMASIASGLSSPDVDQIIQLVFDYVDSVYFATDSDIITQVELKSAAAQSINGYINSSYLDLNNTSNFQNEASIGYLITLLDSILAIPTGSISEYITDVENNILESDLSIEEQTPLLLATQIGRSACTYWTGVINSPGDWSSYISTSEAINTADLPYWVAAAMGGAMVLGNSSLTYGLLEGNAVPSAKVDFISALTGALAVSASKVALRILPKMSGLTGGFSTSFIGSDGLMSARRRNKGCAVTNNCNGGNCKDWCGRQD